MIIDVDWQKEAFAGVRGEGQNIAERKTASVGEARAAHWAKNILLWSSYLPCDCVESMINMGWHRST
jgi:hypothetical protein